MKGYIFLSNKVGTESVRKRPTHPTPGIMLRAPGVPTELWAEYLGSGNSGQLSEWGPVYLEALVRKIGTEGRQMIGEKTRFQLLRK